MPPTQEGAAAHGIGLSRQDSGVVEIRDFSAAVNDGLSPAGCHEKATQMWTFKTNALTMWQQLPWAARFPIAATTAIVVLLALVWALTGFGGLGLDATATVGAVLGIVFTIALAVALMTLIFYSNRSGMDDLLADAGEPGVQVGEDDTRDRQAEQPTRQTRPLREPSV